MNMLTVSLFSSLKDITQAIERAQAASPLAAGKVTLLAASKGQPVEALQEAMEAGITDFGENRVQEAAQKWPSLREQAAIRLHLIGPLQSNKSRDALDLFDVIQTLDRKKLAEELAKHWNAQSRCRSFFVQVNTGREPQKAGILPEEADDFIRYCMQDLGLPVAGLMCIPPHDMPAAPHFALLRQIAARHGLKELSMGMSEDFETAVRMGSSCVRIGRALFGEFSRG